MIGTHYNDQLRELRAMAAARKPPSTTMPGDETTTTTTTTASGTQTPSLGPDVDSLVATIKECRDDELEHLTEAVNNWDAKGAPAYPVLTEVIKGICRVAIKVSERV